MFFVMTLRLSNHTEVLRNIASSSSFFRFRSDFPARISYFKYLELKEFNKTIIPFALVGYETRRYAPRWLLTISYPTHSLYHRKSTLRTLRPRFESRVDWTPLARQSIIQTRGTLKFSPRLVS